MGSELVITTLDRDVGVINNSIMNMELGAQKLSKKATRRLGTIRKEKK